MAPAARTSGVTPWIRIGLAIGGLLVGAVLYVATVHACTSTNAAAIERQDKRLQKMETRDEQTREMMHRMDKRLMLIMHKLGVVEHSELGGPD